MRRSKSRLHHPRAARLTALLVALLCTAGLIVATQQSAASASPSNPSDESINSAQAQKTALANQVGRIQANVVEIRAKLQQLQINLEIAEQRVALALQKLEQAKTAAVAAAANVVKAQNEVKKAQNAFDGYAQQLYMGDPVTGTTGALLTANDPNSLLSEGTRQDYMTQHSISAIGDLQRATVAKSNADAKARLAVINRQKATDDAKSAKDAAAGAFAAAQSQKAALEASLAQAQDSYDQAQYRLETLNKQRQSFEAWSRQRARQLERQHQRALARQRAAEEKLREQQNGGGGGGGGVSNGGGGGSNYPGPPQGGSWSAAKGQAAVNRAARWLGMPYIWAGGNASGPTTGGCTDPVAPCGTLGFDCSGLTLNAWAPYIGLDHFANTQYFQAGRFHPGPGQFMPGDLLFWGNPGVPGGLHHVAIYAGNGNVIQAPESGDVVRVTPWNAVSSDYYGATRPLS